MNIDWAALGTVAGVSLAVTVALVGLFTVGITALSAGASADRSGGSSAAARAGGYACFAVCAAVVAYGIYLIAA